MGQFNSDMQDQMRDLSYELRMLKIDIEYLFANQRHLIEYLANMDKIELTYRSKEIMRELERLRRSVQEDT